MKKMTIVDLYKSGKRILIRNDHEYKQVMPSILGEDVHYLLILMIIPNKDSLT